MFWVGRGQWVGIPGEGGRVGQGCPGLIADQVQNHGTIDNRQCFWSRIIGIRIDQIA
jgi:hypothetical protein